MAGLRRDIAAIAALYGREPSGFDAPAAPPPGVVAWVMRLLHALASRRRVA